MSLVRWSHRHQTKLGVKQAAQTEIALLQVTEDVQRVGGAQTVGRQTVNLGLMEMRKHSSSSGGYRQIVSLLGSALPSINIHTITKGNFIAAVAGRDPHLMPIVVVAALWFSIILVLGILVSWEYKRFINQRRTKFPRDL